MLKMTYGKQFLPNPTSKINTEDTGTDASDIYTVSGKKVPLYFCL